jgi:hypothetical protein
MNTPNTSFDDRLLEEPLQSLEYHRRNSIPKQNGKAPNRSTVWRWASKGVAGQDNSRIFLRIVYVGRVPHTSVEAVRRFLAEVTLAKISAAEKPVRKSQPRSEQTLAKLKALKLI